MGIFVWKPEYSVSVSLLDAQHKRLFALAQTLQDAMSAGKGREVLARCLDDLVAYTKTHFAEEESLLSRHNYADLPQHKSKHLQLINHISDFQKQFASGNAFITIELMDFIQGWITKHILQTDYSYGSFFNKLGVY
jgi:hemerythrin